jgi:hemerythrin
MNLIESTSNRKNTTHVSWSNHYSLGIKLIDDQHKELFNFVNELFNHSTGKEDEERAYFKDVIQAAVSYVKNHFATEEKYMIATKFQGYAEHKKAHDEFIITIVNSIKDFEAGKRLVLEKFAHFLKDWVLSHVAGTDILYAQYFKKIATRKADGKLSIAATDLELISQ